MDDAIDDIEEQLEQKRENETLTIPTIRQMFHSLPEDPSS